MGYKGQTYNIPCDKGGLVHNKNVDLIPPEAMVHPTRNINLHKGGREKRGGTAHVYGSALSGKIMGLYDFVLVDNTQYLLAACNDGKLYKNSTDTIKTGMSTQNKYGFSTIDDKAFICDRSTVPQVWNGSTIADITDTPADWDSGNNPQQIIPHGRGNSVRAWAFGCSNTPHSIYASENGDPQDFSDSNVIKLKIETGDGTGIVGWMEFGDQLMVFSKRNAFIINDSNLDSQYWGYIAAPWEGGAANFRLIIKTPNDLVCMMEDGEIYSVKAVQEYGDYKAASLTIGSFMRQWINEYVKLLYINDFHGIYDPVMRAIKIFVVRNGQTQIDTALVYFIDRPPSEAWMVHGNQSYNSGYSAYASTLVKVRPGDYRIYTGDYGGNVWKLEEINDNDNNNGYYSGFLLPQLTFDNPRITKHYKRGWVITRAMGTHYLYIKIWVDDIELTSQSVSLAGQGVLLNDFQLDDDYLGIDGTIEVDFPIGAKGKRIRMEFYNDNVDEGFFVSQIMIDHKPLSNRPN